MQTSANSCLLLIPDSREETQLEQQQLREIERTRQQMQDLLAQIEQQKREIEQTRQQVLALLVKVGG